MKRGTPDHPKMHELAKLLRIPRYAAVGLMEMLWHWSRVHAPQGNPGRWGAKGVAEGCAWGGDPQRLLASMVGAGWLDAAPAPHHYVIHDIAAHADNAWKQFLVDQGLTWWDGSDPRSGKAGRPAKANPEEISRNLSEISRKSPVPVPAPMPEPVPVPLPPTPSSTAPPPSESPHTTDDYGSWPDADLPDDWQERIARAAHGWPTPSGIERGKALMREAVMQAADKPGTLAILERHIPDQAKYYRKQRFTKSLANVMRDGDWMHPAPADPEEDSF